MAVIHVHVPALVHGVVARREDSSREPLAAARAEDTIHRAQPWCFAALQLFASQGSGEQGRVLRTIYLPSEKADTLLMTVESLQKQLTEVKKLEAGRNAALIEDRQKRDEEEKVRAAADREQIEQLQKQNRRTEEKLREATKMYLGIRHDSKVKERKFTEELEAQRSQVARLTQQLQEERQRASMQIDSIKASAEQEARLYTEQFRREALARDEDLKVPKEQHAELRKCTSAG